MPREVLFDITRLTTRFSRVVPNGIDRVDFGYAEHFLSESRGGRGVLSMGPKPRLVDNLSARTLAAAIGQHWREAESPADEAAFQEVLAAIRGKREVSAPPTRSKGTDWSRLGVSLRGLARQQVVFGKAGLIPGRDVVRSAPEGASYVNVSQFPVWIDGCFRWLKTRPDIKAVFFLHDLLPIHYPEFFPPSEKARHAARIEVMARYAAGIIVAGEHTRDMLAEHLRDTGQPMPPVLVNPLPVTEHFLRSSEPPNESEHASNYFVSIGTIEPRKNQILLLQIWRELARDLGPRTPKLVLAGVRGWENENVIDMIERGPIAFTQHVIEVNGLSTPVLRRLMAGARAVLMPSFAEGYGLPVAEACAAGVPVIASNIDSFREIASPGLVRIDPTDGLGWRHAIVRAMDADRPIFERRLQAEQAVCSTWLLHMSHTENFLASI